MHGWCLLILMRYFSMPRYSFQLSLLFATFAFDTRCWPTLSMPNTLYSYFAWHSIRQDRLIITHLRAISMPLMLLFGIITQFPMICADSTFTDDITQRWASLYFISLLIYYLLYLVKYHDTRLIDAFHRIASYFLFAAAAIHFYLSASGSYHELRADIRFTLRQLLHYAAQLRISHDMLFWDLIWCAWYE